LCEPGAVLDDASCRSPFLHRADPASSSGARTPSTRRAPPRHAFRARDAFHRQVLRTDPSLALRACLSGRHWCPGFATEGPASDMSSRALSRARPECLPPIRRSPRAACRLPTSTAETIHEHAPEPPRPLRCLRRRTAARWVVIPLRSPPAELSQVRGCRNELPFTPCRSDRSPQQIYPDLFDPDTSCRKLVPGTTWKTAAPGDRAVTWSRLRTNSPDAPCRSTVRLAGPPSTPTRESERFGLRPRCLPPLSLSIFS
jgi:hypothetical protein